MSCEQEASDNNDIEITDEPFELTEQDKEDLAYLAREGCWPEVRDYRDGLLAQGYPSPVANRLAMREALLRIGEESMITTTSKGR